MPTFTVHVPTGIAEEALRAERTVFVREGFDWPCFLFGPLALIYRGLWRATLAWVAAALVLLLLASVFAVPALPRLALYLVLAILTGLEAGEARRRALGRSGFIAAALFSGVDRATGERLFFGRRSLSVPLAPAPARDGKPALPSTVLGLFPGSGSRKGDGDGSGGRR